MKLHPDAGRAGAFSAHLELAAEAILFALICRRARTRRKSSFDTIVLRRHTLLAGRRSVRGMDGVYKSGVLGVEANPGQ